MATLAATIASGRKLIGLRLPAHDPVAFSDGETITINGDRYTVQVQMLGANRVIIAIPAAPHRGGSIFLGLMA